MLLNAAAAAALRAPRTPPRAGHVDGLRGPEIAVLGGGFGGLYTALRLCSLDWSGGPRPRVTLVDRDERFSFSPMLYELVAGTATCWEVAPLYEELLEGSGVEFVRAEVRGLDEEPPKGEPKPAIVQTADGAAAEAAHFWSASVELRYRGMPEPVVVREAEGGGGGSEVPLT